MAGCDRWQQLGLGSANGGSSGYTWIDGKLWQDRFVLSNSVLDLMMMKNKSSSDGANSLRIRDVALGGDHTLVLASNQRDVYAFGKGGDGQLGLVGKPFVTAPVKSKTLSEDSNDGVLLSAICAIQKCSVTLDATGSVRKKAGKCRATTMVDEGIQECIARAKQAGLITKAD
jgi:alpha-tubulin suppressor-like RCC1 family protein